MKNLIRKSIYVTLGKLDLAFGAENNIVIYCYHNISSNPWAFHVSKSLFEKHMAKLARWGQPVKISDVCKFIEGKAKLPKRAFAVTFDDGYKGILKILPVVKKYNITPTVFVLAAPKKLDRKEMATNSKVLSQAEIKKLIEEGFEIGSHGLTHKRLDGDEIGKSKVALQRDLGIKINYFSYPHGKYNAELKNEVKQSGYDFGFSMDDEKISRKSSHLAIPRVGVLNNHSGAELLFLASPSVLKFRKLIKKTPFKNFI